MHVWSCASFTAALFATAAAAVRQHDMTRPDSIIKPLNEILFGTPQNQSKLDFNFQVESTTKNPVQSLKSASLSGLRAVKLEDKTYLVVIAETS
jgi:hypothetical protein